MLTFADIPNDGVNMFAHLASHVADFDQVPGISRYAPV